MNVINKELYEKIQEAKIKIGDEAIQLIADHFHLEIFQNGNTTKASCPFGHIDNTPSFIWNTEEKYFHCFSCGKNYGIFDLLIDQEKNSSAAIKKLFQMADIDYQFNLKEDNEDFFVEYCFPPEEANTDRTKVDEYCEKRGISTRTLDEMGIKQDKRGNVVFELRDLDNRLLSIKYRASHSVKKGEAKTWWYQEKDANGKPKRSVAPLLFNMNRVDFTKPLLIVEGYFDALACYEAGYKNVVSIYGGAEDDNWIQFNFEFLEQFKDIILWYDNDTAGKNGLNKAVSRLGEYRCKVVTPEKEHEDLVEEYYHLLGVSADVRKTDANNVLLGCGKEAVLSLINNAKEIPSKRLKYLMDYEPTNVKDMEKVSTGFKAIDKLIYGSLFPCFTIWSGYAGCVDADTEYFNGKEWRRIADYIEGDKVLQYNPNGQAELVIPQQYHKYPATQLWHMTANGIDQCLSDEHNVVYLDKTLNIKTDKFDNIRNKIEKDAWHYNRFISVFDCDGKGLNLTIEEVQEYIQNLLGVREERPFTFCRDLIYRCYELSRPQRYVIFQEVMKHKTENSFGEICLCRSCDEEFVDFVQFVFASLGYRTVINKQETPCEVSFVDLNSNEVSFKYDVAQTYYTIYLYNDVGNYNIKIEPYQTKDGYKYCFTTDSHMWVMRRNGKIVVTGNSGKSSLANIACLIEPVEHGYKTFVYSGELDNGQLSDWIFSPLAGTRHTLMFENPNGRPSYAASKEALKCIKDFYRTKFILYDDEDGLDSSGETVLMEMENAYRRYNCRVFLIDNLMTLSFDQLSEDSRWETQKKFIKRLMGFTKKYNVNVNLIVHPKKPVAGIVTEHSVYDLHGASEIGNLCHRLIWIDRLKDDDFGYNTKISIVKDRPSQAAGKECKLYYNYATRRLHSDDEELERGYEWESHYTVTYSKDTDKKRLCNIPKDQCDQF